MGNKKKKNEKKGKGAEKTAAKTEKKTKQKLKKELKLAGEEDIEKLLAEVQEFDRKRLEVTEDIVPPPSPRSNFSFVAHPDKDEFLLFGGEFFNGSKTFVYNDLFVYNIKKNEWTLVKAPNAPPPRSAHQAVALSQGGGQLWVFGGEFTSPTQAQFHHFKDLWVFHLQNKQWEKVTATGGPSSRSGHRMVVCKKLLMVFGGFHDNGRDYKYFNDVYAFDLETYKWHKLEASGSAPSPRSGCQIAALLDGCILIYGGYSKDRLKKDIDKGIVHFDMFFLQPEKGDQTGLKWRWVPAKQGGCRPSPRSGCSLTVSPNANRAYVFGGVYDLESEEALVGTFYDDLYQLELETGKWHNIVPCEKIEKDKKKRRRAKEEEQVADSTHEEDANVSRLILEGESDSTEAAVTTLDDGIFTVTIGPQGNSCESEAMDLKGANDDTGDCFTPCARMNAGLAIKRGVLYVYGGVYEINDKEVTMADLHSLDLQKLDRWRTLIEYDEQQLEWVESESSDEEQDEATGGQDDTGSGDSEEDDEDEDNDAMDIA